MIINDHIQHIQINIFPANNKTIQGLGLLRHCSIVRLIRPFCTVDHNYTFEKIQYCVDV